MQTWKIRSRKTSPNTFCEDYYTHEKRGGPILIRFSIVEVLEKALDGCWTQLETFERISLQKRHKQKALENQANERIRDKGMKKEITTSPRALIFGFLKDHCSAAMQSLVFKKKKGEENSWKKKFQTQITSEKIFA